MLKKRTLVTLVPIFLLAWCTGCATHAVRLGDDSAFFKQYFAENRTYPATRMDLALNREWFSSAKDGWAGAMVLAVYLPELASSIVSDTLYLPADLAAIRSESKTEVDENLEGERGK